MARGRLDNSLPSDPEREASPLGLPQLLLADHGGDRAGGGELKIRRIDKRLLSKISSQVQFHQPGSLRLGTSPIRMDEFRYALSRQVGMCQGRKYF